MADSLEPLSLVTNANLADAMCVAHLHVKCADQSREILELNPDFAMATTF